MVDEVRFTSRWCLGNGQKTKFWTDQWLDSTGSLADFVDRSSHHINENLTVAKSTLNGSWNVDIFAAAIPTHVMEKILASQPPSGSDEDKQIWALSPSGKFTLNLALDYLSSGQNVINMDHTNWSKIWKWQGPPRIHSFL